MEIYYSNLAQSFSLQRACTGIFYRDCLGSCQAISYGPLVLRSCIEITDSVLPRRSLQRNLNTGSLHSDQRSCTHFSIEIFTEGTCRIYPGFSFFSCSLQDCLGSLAGDNTIYTRSVKHVRCNPDVCPPQSCGRVAYFHTSMQVNMYVYVHIQNPVNILLRRGGRRSLMR